MTHSVVATEERHFESLHQALDIVAREKKYLAQTQAPPLAQSIAFEHEGLARRASLIDGIYHDAFKMALLR